MTEIEKVQDSVGKQRRGVKSAGELLEVNLKAGGFLLSILLLVCKNAIDVYILIMHFINSFISLNIL